MKTKQVKIGTEVEPKFMKIRDYWDDVAVDKVVELLHEYQDLFPMKFSDLKGITGDLGIMNITLKMDMKPIKERPYRLNPKYKEKVHQELDKMLEVGIIERVEESDWVSAMVVQEKKQKGEIRICVDLQKRNDVYVHDSFLAPFIDEVLDNDVGQEAYFFTDGFSGYHQVKIMPKNKIKTTFVMEWGWFQYTVMPFGLKNAPAIFSRVVTTTFKEFIHKFLEVYFDDSTMFGLIKCHVARLRLMLDTYRRYQIVLNLKKCIFCVPFGILLGHVVCKQGLMVDPGKIEIIVNLEAPRNIKQLRTTLGHTRYYRKFIKAYAQIIAPMEKLLKKDATFCQDVEYQCSLDVLKEKMLTAPILVFPDWKKEFHVHVYASCITLGVVLMQAGK